jgi:hypothetical protein
LSHDELQLIKQLREHPELLERFHSILEIAANAEGPMKPPDEIEARLIEQMRQPGHVGMESGASSAERTSAQHSRHEQAIQAERPTPRSMAEYYCRLQDHVICPKTTFL